MGKAHDRELLRQELVRLLDGLEFYRSWRITALKRAKGSVTQADLNQIVDPASYFLEIFDATKDSRCISVLKDVQQWYAMTGSELHHILQVGNASTSTNVRQFLAAFAAEFGFAFFAEAGMVYKLAKAVLQRGVVSGHDDYYILKELEGDQSQTIISADDMSNMAKLLRDFERRQVDNMPT